MTQRRIPLSAARIEEIIAVGQRRGLTATSVSHYPDGRTEVHFGDGGNGKAHKPQGWKV